DRRHIMRRRFLEALGVAAVIMAVVLLLKSARAPVGAQAGQPGTAAKAGPAPTTPSGDPDLQGIWTRDSDEPLQRPAKYASKETFTDEERAARMRGGQVRTTFAPAGGDASLLHHERRGRIGRRSHQSLRRTGGSWPRRAVYGRCPSGFRWFPPHRPVS